MTITKLPDLDVEFGNAGDLDTHGSGWFIAWSDWAKSSGTNLRHMPIDVPSTGLCVKWYLHEPGHPNGEEKPLSEGRTISILVGEPGEFRLDFCRTLDYAPGATRTTLLRRTGDFAIWGPGLYHRAFGIRRACILTIRWQPQPR
jgi:hypothetical protein